MKSIMSAMKTIGSPSAGADAKLFMEDSSSGEWPHNFQTKHLLIIDDDDLDRERLNRYVKDSELPIAVSNAANAADALRMIGNGGCDLILTDYNLGDMSGNELLAQVKKEIGESIPCIMVTGAGDESVAIEALRNGVIDYFPKYSLKPERLLSVIIAALRKKDVERKLQKTQERLYRMSLFDELTGLPNRNLFLDRLNQAMHFGRRNSSGFTLMMIDLNLFKEINDTYGHWAGDQVLKTIGQRLLPAARESDTFARIGGDEFSCILHEVNTAEAAITCAHKLHSIISVPIHISGNLVRVTASIGFAHFPEHGEDATTILSNADSAMYEAKRSHQGFVSFSQDWRSKCTLASIPVAQRLHQAILDHELVLEYQPKVNIKNHQVIGVEALVRWNSPKYGLIMPGDFIPIAERSTLIEEVSFETFDMAFAQLSEWQKQGLDIQVATNLSARMLDDQHLAGKLKERLDTFGVSGEHVTLEITETALASSFIATQDRLADLLKLGFKISIDDFGSGFTSFRYIRDIPFSELKVDRLFVENLKSGSRDAAILRSIAVMAERLGIRAVAEGVESAQQIEILESLGYGYVQGYVIARPISASTLVNWLAAYDCAQKLGR